MTLDEDWTMTIEQSWNGGPYPDAANVLLNVPTGDVDENGDPILGIDAGETAGESAQYAADQDAVEAVADKILKGTTLLGVAGTATDYILKSEVVIKPA